MTDRPELAATNTYANDSVEIVPNFSANYDDPEDSLAEKSVAEVGSVQARSDAKAKPTWRGGGNKALCAVTVCVAVATAATTIGASIFSAKKINSSAASVVGSKAPKSCKASKAPKSSKAPTTGSKAPKSSSSTFLSCVSADPFPPVTAGDAFERVNSCCENSKEAVCSAFTCFQDLDSVKEPSDLVMADTCTCRDVIEVIDDAAYGNLVAVLLSLLGLSVSDVNDTIGICCPSLCTDAGAFNTCAASITQPSETLLSVTTLASPSPSPSGPSPSPSPSGPSPSPSPSPRPNSGRLNTFGRNEIVAYLFAAYFFSSSSWEMFMF